jgi:hypothetical protein
MAAEVRSMMDRLEAAGEYEIAAALLCDAEKVWGR